MLLLSLSEIERAVRASWSAETCDPVDLPWSRANPAKGQCGVTAAVLHDLLGGQVLIAPVVHADGSSQGVHYWNRLPSGVEVDLTREQFRAGERVGTPQVAELPPPGAGRLRHQYALLRQRVHDLLS